MRSLVYLRCICGGGNRSTPVGHITRGREANGNTPLEINTIFELHYTHHGLADTTLHLASAVPA